MLVAATPLTALEKAFFREYSIDFNGEKAAIRAGYDKRNAREVSKLLLDREDSQRILTAIMNDRKSNYDLTVSKIVEDLYHMCFTDPLELYEADGSPKPLDEISTSARATILQVSSTVKRYDGERYVHATYTRVDKLKAMEHLGKFLGMWMDGKKDEKSSNPKDLDDKGLDELIQRLIAEEGIGKTINGETAQDEATEDYVTIP